MTDRITIKLPEGVEYEHPEVQRLLNEIEAVKPLPVKLTVREQLAEKLNLEFTQSGGFTQSSDHKPKSLWRLSPQMQANYLAEADAAIEFFRTVLVQVRDVNLILVGDPAAVRVHNDAIEQLTIDLGKALSK